MFCMLTRQLQFLVQDAVVQVEVFLLFYCAFFPKNKKAKMRIKAK